MAIHGLNGHREATWTINSVNWLRDLLPSNIPNAHIYTWGYDANTHSTSQISAQYLYDHARTLISDLCLKRRMTKVLALYLHGKESLCWKIKQTQTRPIIFVAHSLGGIVLKTVRCRGKTKIKYRMLTQIGFDPFWRCSTRRTGRAAID